MTYHHHTNSNGTKTKFTPAIGEDFDLYNVDPEVIKALTQLEVARAKSSTLQSNANTRNFLAILVTSFLLGTLVASALYGIVDSDIHIVAATWSAVTATLTLILSFYFNGD